MTHHPGFLNVLEEAKRRIQVCTVAEVKAKLDRGETFHVLDVPEDYELANDHVKGARHLGLGVIERHSETGFPTNRPRSSCTAAEDFDLLWPPTVSAGWDLPLSSRWTAESVSGARLAIRWNRGVASDV